MRTTRFPAATRGHANYGWLDTYHSFSFARWYDPNRMGFGALRVLNDDKVAPDRGFSTHPHDNMEIITIVLKGAVAHRDSEGNVETIPAGDVQWMSAGTGVTHSEFNPSRTDTLHLLQIWILPRQNGLRPSYDQRSFGPEGRQGKWQRLASPDGAQGSIRIQQDAWLHRTELAAGASLAYAPLASGSVQYVHVISGSVQVAGETLGPGDGLGIESAQALNFTAASAADFLLFELPR